MDFCFKELMQDKKVRKGLIAALLNVNPTEVESTTLMPTTLRKRYPEDFKRMAEKDEYIGEAYEALKNMSEDEIKRMEYEARQKAIRDYNSYMHSAERRGIKNGIKNGIKIGRAEILKQQVEKKLAKGKSLEIIADECEEEISVIQALINEIRAE